MRNHKEDVSTYLTITAIMGIFTFLFLGAEYLYVDVLSRIVSQEKTVLAQNYALGVSTAGFVLYPLSNRIGRRHLKVAGYSLISLLSVLLLFLVCAHMSYAAVLAAGLVLFLLLGFFGGSSFYVSVRKLKTDHYLARTVGISYAIGILLQFANNNLIRSEYAEAVVLSVFLLALACLLAKYECFDGGQEEMQPDAAADMEKSSEKGAVVGALLIFLVVLMSCIFSTLDNIVTLSHAAGVEDIGQWPRILLAASGLCAGFLFDIKSRKYMGVAMYCVMILSTLCIAVQRLSGPFLLGLVVFYMSAGFFAVFFTAGFMELSRYMRVPGLWAGMGRAVNNLTAALIANPVLMLISGKDDFAVIALLLALFVFISITAFFYTSRRYLFLNQPKSENAGGGNHGRKAAQVCGSLFLYGQGSRSIPVSCHDGRYDPGNCRTDVYFQKDFGTP